MVGADRRCQREVPTVSADGTSVPGPYGKGTSRLEVTGSRVLILGLLESY